MEEGGLGAEYDKQELTYYYFAFYRFIKKNLTAILLYR